MVMIVYLQYQTNTLMIDIYLQVQKSMGKEKQNKSKKDQRKYGRCIKKQKCRFDGKQDTRQHYVREEEEEEDRDLIEAVKLISMNIQQKPLNSSTPGNQRMEQQSDQPHNLANKLDNENDNRGLDEFQRIELSQKPKDPNIDMKKQDSLPLNRRIQQEVQLLRQNSHNSQKSQESKANIQNPEQKDERMAVQEERKDQQDLMQIKRDQYGRSIIASKQKKYKKGMNTDQRGRLLPYDPHRNRKEADNESISLIQQVQNQQGISISQRLSNSQISQLNQQPMQEQSSTTKQLIMRKNK